MTNHSFHSAFQPGDILLLHGGDSPFDRLEKWALSSPFVHCMIYWMETKRGLSLIIESVGKGVVIRPLLHYEGRKLRWLRHRDSDAGPRAAKAAERIADRADSFYDYRAITRWVLPRLICQKLGLPMPLSWHRNRYFLCSELVAEAYLEAGYPLVPDDTVPLPGDFAESPKLESLGDIGDYSGLEDF